MTIVVRFILFQSSFLIETTSVASERESTEKSVREGVSPAGSKSYFFTNNIAISGSAMIAIVALIGR